MKRSKKEPINLTNEESNYTLLDCLHTLSDNQLDILLGGYKEFTKNKLPKKINKREDKIKLLNEFLPELFKEILTMDFITEDLFENYTPSSNHFLEETGLVYIIDEKPVLPLEFKKIYNSFKVQDNDIAVDKAKYFLSLCNTIYSTVPKEIYHEILDNRHIKISKKKLEEILKESNMTLYKDKFYVLDSSSRGFKATKLLINHNKDLPYKVLDNEELESYADLLKQYLKDLEKIKIPDDFAEEFYLSSLIDYEDAHDKVKRFQEKYKFNNNKSKQLIKLLTNYEDSIRYWALKGRTLKEFSLMNTINDYTMIHKPKSTSLKECLKLLEPDILKDMYDFYEIDEDINLLSETIIKELSDEVFDMDIDFIDFLVNCENKLCDDHLDEFDILSGFYFIYKDGEKSKIFVPNECLEVLKDYLDESKNLFTDDISNPNNLVLAYLDMNGIIEKNVLKKLLKENNDITINTEELDTIIKNEGFYTVFDNYYTLDKNLFGINETFTNNFLQNKKEFGEYKEVNEQNLTCTNFLLFSLESYLDSINIDEIISRNIISNILIKMHLNSVNKKELFKDLDKTIKINTKDKEEILKIINSFKNDISIWQYNGYSLNDISKKDSRKKD